ncbi:hypothetical protein [Micromonospora chalcea]|uniref:hypothetical protein n=1 Tax=Micromonospora chalcea TaxID=1874 RepID=UPI003D764F9F
MEKRWIEVEPYGPDRAGDVGGDNQISEAWGRRFVLPRRADGLIPVMDLDFFAERNLTVSPDGIGVTRQTHFALCRDLNDVGGTEEWADCDSASIGGDGAKTGGDALLMCKQAPAPTLGWWDGEPFHGNPPAAPPLQPADWSGPGAPEIVFGRR